MKKRILNKLVKYFLYIYYEFICSKGFNGDKYLKEKIYELIYVNNINTIIETGTFRGSTTKEFSTMVDNVISIENNPKLFKKAKVKLKKFKNIKLYFGNSPLILNKIIPKVKVPVLFYLDAHTNTKTFLIEELMSISNFSSTKNSVIIIHDFYVPNQNYLFLETDKFKQDYNSIKKQLNNINHTFLYEYNKKSHGVKVGVIFIYPKRGKNDYM
jgi:hypothetical protein